MAAYKKPRLTLEDVYKEIYNRTGVNINAIHRVLWAYNEIVKESLVANVEVPFGDIGLFSWKFIKPHDRRAWDGVFGKDMKDMKLRHFAGYQRTTLRVGKKWRDYLRDLTSFDYYGDEDGEEVEIEEEGNGES